MDYLRRLYYDFLVIFLVLIFSTGIVELVNKAIVDQTFFTTFLGYVWVSMVVAAPLTVLKIFTDVGTFIDKKALWEYQTLFRATIITYTFIYLLHLLRINYFLN